MHITVWEENYLYFPLYIVILLSQMCMQTEYQMQEHHFSKTMNRLIVILLHQSRPNDSFPD